MVSQKNIRSCLFAALSSLCFVSALLTATVSNRVAAQENSEPKPDSAPKALEDYLHLPDDTFAWKIVENNLESDKADNTLLIEMVSQTWHDIPWKHYLLIAVPNQIVCSDHAILYIGGKRIGSKPGDGDRWQARMLAQAAGMPVGMLFQVPNQPLLGNYVEDALIGETMLKAMETKDLTWPLLFPMAKSALRGMDVVQQVLQKERRLDVKNFIVSGASKRGWTTWMTAASKDSRVKAIAPIVIDTLNLQRQMEYQLETWGDFSPAIHDYTDRDLVKTDPADRSEIEQTLWTIVDPYSYRSRYTMPKLLVHGTNDPYWTVDAAKFYWDDLPGVKYILTLPNTGHGLDGQQIKALQTIAVFARHTAENKPWPRLSWELEEQEGQYSIQIKSDWPDKRTKLWMATSETKDFRQAHWTAIVLRSGISQPIIVSKPKSGHVAFFVELNANAYGLPASLTTQVWRF